MITLLEDTVGAMVSTDYRERFKAEYYQTKIRYEKLKDLNTRIKAHNITVYEKDKVVAPQHSCPEDLLREQQHIMGEYLHVLEVRAVIEGIEL